MEERKAHLRGKLAKEKCEKPLNSVATQPEPEAQNEKPVGSSWTAIAGDEKKNSLENIWFIFQ